MGRQTLALALCRVSSAEQLENNSLNRQREAVLKAAKKFNLHIPNDGWWSGSVSSKKGSNVNRKDLSAILDYCKKNKNVKYLIVDELDRFMRSMLEIGYFLIQFKLLGVGVIFASQPDLKTDTATDTLLLMFEAFKAEGSNEERQRKSIKGQEAALRQGRYPFVPKPGYRKGAIPGVPEIHPVRGRALRASLIRIALRLVTPSEALKEFNASDFMKDHAPYKMDKFRKIITDPFYAGIVTIDKQVSVHNPNGLHESLITLKQHETIVKIMDGKAKNQSGPRKNGNPHYPCNNLISCDGCSDKKNNRVVGFDHTNGKPNSKIYEKYRCRGCGKYWTREALHKMVVNEINRFRLSPKAQDNFIKALNATWKQREDHKEQEATRLRRQIKNDNLTISQKVDAVTNPDYASVKAEIMSSLSKLKDNVSNLERQLDELTAQEQNDHEQFLRFAFDFINKLGSNFLDISYENRLRCKQILFPAGFRLAENGKVYTPEISPIYRLATTKKDLPETEKSFMVPDSRRVSNYFKYQY
jgi:DNA invertase Pin-like site-specific DNA recombinase